MKKYISSFPLKHFLLTLVTGSSLPLYAADGGKTTTASSDSMVLTLLIVLIVVLLFVIIVLAGAIRNVASNRQIWLNRWSGTSMLILAAAGLFVPGQAFAAGNSTGGNFVLSSEVFYLLLITIGFLALIAIFLAITLKNLLNELNTKKEAQVSFIEKWTANLTEAVPVAHEEAVMTDHEYDGIRELDNVLPPWWVYLFYLTIIFSVVYLVRYHIVGSGNVMEEEYQAEIEQAALLKAAAAEASPESMIDENNVILLSSSSDLERGNTIFQANCASCHRADGGGEIGPNLTDRYWLHGGSINDIFATIKYGVPEKGMISWQAQIKPDDMQRVASYIMSLEGTQPTKPKAPEGELYVPEADTTTAAMPEDTTAADTASMK